MLDPVPAQQQLVRWPVSLALRGRDREQAERIWFARGLPPGVSIDPLRGVILGSLA